jgi:hypothetical protein
MKKYFIYIILVSVAFSCSDFLDIEPRQETSITEQFSTLSGTKIALAGAYYKTEDIQSDNFFVYPDLVGGNITFTPTQQGSNLGIISNRGQLVSSYDFNDFAISSNFASFYSNCYNVINNTNNIINFADGLPDATTAQKNQIKAEALALRAFLHFNLLQLYGQTYNFSTNANHKGIVYADRILTGGIDFPSRLSVAASYDLIVKDLQTALSLFTQTQALPGPVYSYFTPTSTKAILARVALQKNDWQLALTFANDVIATSGVSLLNASNYISDWEKPNLPVSEVLFELSAPTDSATQLVSSTVAKFYRIVYTSVGTPPVLTVNNYSEYSASQDLIDLFASNDIRKNAFITQSLPVKTSTGFVNRNFNFTKKHQDNAGTIVSRLSEMYLIQAEANARLNNTAGALTALNIIRNRANLPDLVVTANLLEEIFLERRRELCFESCLFFDTARFNKNVTRNFDCFSILCNLNYPNNRFVLPIPRSSIDINQNMIQNEGY